MKDYQAKNIRNLSVVGHGSEGKTTLVEALLFTAGAIEKGLAEDSLDLDFDGSAYQIPADVMEKYNAAVAAIKDGTIVVPSTIEEAKVWKAA